MAPRKVEAPRDPAHSQNPEEVPVDTMKSSAPCAPPSEATDHDETLEAHYSGLERLRPHGCYEGFVYIGRLEVDPETGEEVELIEVVSCRRCAGGDGGLR